MATLGILIITVLLVGTVHASIDAILREVEEKNEARMDGLPLTNIDGAEFVKYQFDMLMKKDEFESLMAGDGVRRIRRNAAKKKKLWPRHIPYEIETKFNVSQKLTIHQAMQHIMQHTCIVFKNRTQENNYVKFIMSSRCESRVGMYEKTNNISLTNSCVTKSGVVHEILHALGLYHEHMRNDRDAYVTIHDANIEDGEEKQFRLMDKTEYKDYGKPYDYRSVMHYGKHFYAKPHNATHEKITIEPTQDRFLDVIGEAPGLSFYDIKILNSMYKCAAKCQQTVCASGQFIGRACECYCQGPPENAAVPCVKPSDNCFLLDHVDPNVHFVEKVPEQECVDLTDNPQVRSGQTIEVTYLETEDCGYQILQSTCQNGTWDKPIQLPCVKERCTLDPAWYRKYDVYPTKYLNQMSEKQTELPHNEFVDLICPLDTANSAKVTCKKGRWKWQGRIKNCNKHCLLTTVENGEIRMKGAPYTTYYIGLGQQITVHCDIGYQIMYKKRVLSKFKTKCKKRNLLKRPLPTCQKIPGICLLSELYDHNYMPLKDERGGLLRIMASGDTLTATCKESYYHQDNATEVQVEMRCDNGTIEDAIPCEQKRCLLSELDDHNYMPLKDEHDNSLRTMSSGETLIATCKDGYQLQDNATEVQVEMRCDNGTIEDAIPCEQRRCLLSELEDHNYMPLNDEHGLSLRTMASGDTLTVRCKNGYQLQGNTTEVPVEMRCDHTLSLRLTASGDTYIVRCKNGYLPEANTTEVQVEMRCDNGTIEDATPCEPNGCPPTRSFKCRSGKCLSALWVCDGRDNCRDNSDEENCATYVCPPTRSFKCRSGVCIEDSRVCNGRDSCGDNSDEQDCATYVCPPTRSYKCTSSGVCIEDSRVCNGRDDCRDNSDEENCATYVCPPTRSYKCRWSSVCIEDSRVCNGMDNCGDNSDEENCDVCQPSAFKCQSHRKCIRDSWVCNGYNDCVDNSDEENCAKYACPPTRSFKCASWTCLWEGQICNGMTATYVCPPDRSFKCRSGKCIPDSDVCNGWDDCLDNSDEEDCDVCPSAWTFKCMSGKCISNRDVCDGYNDCVDNSDEENCAAYDCPPARSFKCASSGVCLNVWDVCDGKGDCRDYSDEENCATYVCPPTRSFKCTSSGLCLYDWEVCNGEDDCGDDSDEKDCG